MTKRRRIEILEERVESLSRSCRDLSIMNKGLYDFSKELQTRIINIDVELRKTKEFINRRKETEDDNK